jgi:hypothetical protein
VLIRDSRPLAASCEVCGDRWGLHVLDADAYRRAVGPLTCPAGCGADDPAQTSGPQRQAGFRPDSEPYLV